jgi:MFS family permease
MAKPEKGAAPSAADAKSEGRFPALAALGHRNYRLFYIALVVAGIGAQIQRTTNVWQVYELTHSTIHLGLTGLAQGLPILILSLIGGVIADRIDRRRLIMVTQGIFGCLGLVLAVLTAAGLIRVWHIYAITIVGSALTALNTPARSALIPNLVPKHHLLNAMALNSTVWQISNLAGPAVAGACIALMGTANTYMLNGAAHLVTLGALALMQLAPVLGRARTGKSPLRDIIEGLSFVRARSIILVLLSMDVAARFLGSYQVLLPVFATRLGVGAEGMGLLMSAPAAGGLLGSMVILSLGNIRYKGLVVVGGILAYCLSLFLLAVSPWFWLALVATALLGLFDSFNATPRNTLIQSMTPDELRGRVSGFQSMLTTGGPTMGHALSGGVAAILGAPLAVIAGSVTCIAVILGLVSARKDLRAADL